MEKYQHLSSPVNSDHESADSEIVFLKKPTKDRLAPTTSTQEPQDMELDSEVERSKQDRIVRRETVRILTTSPEVGPASLRCCGSAGEEAGVRPTAHSRGPPGGREDGVASQPGAATSTLLSVRQATFLPILVFLGLFVLDLWARSVVVRDSPASAST